MDVSYSLPRSSSHYAPEANLSRRPEGTVSISGGLPRTRSGSMAATECCYFMLGGRNPGLPRAFMYGFNVLWLSLVTVSAILGTLVHQGYYFISIGCVMLAVITWASYSIHRSCTGQVVPMVSASNVDVNDPFFGPPPPYEVVVIAPVDEPPNYAQVMRVDSEAPKESETGSVESERLLSNEPNGTTVQGETVEK